MMSWQSAVDTQQRNMSKSKRQNLFKLSVPSVVGSTQKVFVPGNAIQPNFTSGADTVN